MLDLPRSARLALWGSAALRGELPADQACARVTRDDEPHLLRGGVGWEPAATLVELLDDLRASGVRGLRLVLPAPGDPLGLPGPPAFNADAVEAGEAVLGDAGTPFGLVPEVREFGSVLEPGALVTWHAHEVGTARAGSVESPVDAERALHEALATATSALADLDVSRWREDAAERIAALRGGALPRDAVPPGLDGRTVGVLVTATRVREIVSLATEDDGAAVSGWEATQRARVLRDVDGVARRALAAAVSSSATPARDAGHVAGRSSAPR